MKNYLIAMLALVCLSGCATADKLSKPKGSWTNINPIGFIPPETTVYTGKTKPVSTVGANQSTVSLQPPVTTKDSTTTPTP